MNALNLFSVSPWLAAHGPFIGVLGAAIILASWGITNVIATRYAEAASNLRRIAEDEAFRDKIGGLRRQLRELRGPLDRIELMVSEMNPESPFSMFPNSIQTVSKEIHALAAVVSSGFNVEEQITDLIMRSESVLRVSGIPRSDRDKLETTIASARKELAILRSAAIILEEKRQLVIKGLENAGNSSKMITNVDTSLKEAYNEYITATKPVQLGYATWRQRLEDVRSEALSGLTRRTDHLRRLKGASEKLSWLLYVVGTTLATYAAWLEGAQKLAKRF